MQKTDASTTKTVEKKSKQSILFAGLVACGVSVRSTVTALSTEDTDTAYTVQCTL